MSIAPTSKFPIDSDVKWNQDFQDGAGNCIFWQLKLIKRQEYLVSHGLKNELIAVTASRG